MGKLLFALTPILVSVVSIAYTGFNTYWRALPQSEEFADFYNYARTLQPALAEGRVPLSQLEINQSGGTSVYFKVKYDGKYGAWLPTNSATNYRGEIFAFNLGRLLKVDPHLVGTAIQMPLKGVSFNWFLNELNTTRFRNSSQQQNQQNILEMMSRSSTLEGVYAQWGPKPADYDDIVNYRSGGNGVLRADHPIARKLNCSVSLQDRRIRVRKVSGAEYANEKDLVRQLSNMMLIDALNLQWDRFSGGNLQVIKHPVSGDVSFVSYDNGGTQDRYRRGYLSHTYVQRIKKWVTRYDRDSARRIKQIYQFLYEGGSLDDFSSEQDLMRAMGVKNDRAWLRKWESFKLVLKEVNEHLDSLAGGCLF